MGKKQPNPYPVSHMVKPAPPPPLRRGAIVTKVNDNMYQNVIITLSDGTICTFTGKAFVTNPDKETRSIRNIEFTVPKPLPVGYSFELKEG